MCTNYVASLQIYMLGCLLQPKIRARRELLALGLGSPLLEPVTSGPPSSTFSVHFVAVQYQAA